MLAVCLGIGPLGVMAEPPGETAAVLQAMAEAGHDPDALILRMAEIYDEVRVTERVRADEGVDARFARFGSFSIFLEMRREGVPVATGGCQGFGLDDLDVVQEDFRADASRFGAAVRMPAVEGNARRVLCSLYVWDGPEQAVAVRDAALGWGGARIGVFSGDEASPGSRRESVVDAALRATGRPWAMTVWDLPGGEIGAVQVMLIFEEPAAPG
ncbi:MAG: hypothetical protein ACRC6I_03055 [Paracoccaceae bacterium]